MDGGFPRFGLDLGSGAPRGPWRARTFRRRVVARQLGVQLPGVVLSVGREGMPEVPAELRINGESSITVLPSSRPLSLPS